MTTDAECALNAASTITSFDASHAELIRAGENHLYRLAGKVVARVTRPGQIEAARKEVRVSRWLASAGVPVVEALADVQQPIEIDGRAVTFWRELPSHRRGELTELADLLKQLHSLPMPNFELPPLAPFIRLRERLTEAAALSNDDRSWLFERLSDLEHRHAALPSGRPLCAVHGDAWSGNVAVTDDGPVLLDLERFAYGPPEWDLTSIAVSYTTFGSISSREWNTFCDSYGYDVTLWRGFEVFRDIRELRKVTFAWQLAGEREDIATQAKYRLACLRGKHGARSDGSSHNEMGKRLSTDRLTALSMG